MAVAIKNVVGTERNHMAARQHMMRAAVHYSANVEVVCIEEAGDGNAKQVFRSKLFSQYTGKEILRPLTPARFIPLAALAATARLPAQILQCQLPRLGPRKADAIGQEI